jgi:hypothetical protein
MRDNNGTININYVDFDSLNRATQKQIISKLKYEDDAIPYEMVTETGAPTERSLDAILREYENVLARFQELLERHGNK